MSASFEEFYYVEKARADKAEQLLRELYEYTTDLEKKSAAWFLSRSHAVRPKVDPTLGARVREVVG